jgi:hypothetical protein
METNEQFPDYEVARLIMPVIELVLIEEW